jgi:hypothetical protein
LGTSGATKAAIYEVLVEAVGIELETIEGKCPLDAFQIKMAGA